MLVISSIVGVVVAVLALLQFGLTMAVGIALLSVIAYGLSKILALVGDILIHLAEINGRANERTAAGEVTKSAA